MNINIDNYIIKQSSFYNNFLSGMKFLFKGMKLIYGRYRDLWPYYIIPLILTVIAIGSLSLFLFPRVDDWIAILWDKPILTGFWSWIKISLWYLLYFISLIASFIIIMFVFIIIYQIIFIPFKGALANKIESLLTQKPQPKFSWRQFFSELWFTIKLEAKRISLYIIIMAILFVLNFIPLIGSIVFTIGSWLLTSTFLSLEFIDQPLTNREIGFFERIRIIRNNFSVYLGFGTAIFLILSIPVVSFIVVPAALTGGVLLFLQIEEPHNLKLD